MDLTIKYKFNIQYFTKIKQKQKQNNKKQRIKIVNT